MKYKASLNLHCIDFTNHGFESFGSTMQSAINKARKQAVKAGFNALNSNGQIVVYKRKNSEYDNNYYYVTAISAWN